MMGTTDNDKVQARGGRGPRPPGKSRTKSPDLAPEVLAVESWRFVLPVVAFFLAASLVKALCHDLWGDELRVWMIVRDSTSLADLWERIRYEGHPILWFLCLYPLSALTADVRAMQMLHVLIATATAFVILRHSPFGRITKVLLIFGYYPFFEFNTISRDYALGFLCVVLAITFLTRPKPAWVWCGLLLGLATQSDVYATILALAVAAGAAMRWRKEIARLPKRRLWLGLGIFMALLFSAAHQVMRVSDSQWRGIPDRLPHSLSGPWLGLIPIPKPVYAYWNTNVLAPSSMDGNWWPCAVLSVILVMGVCWVFPNRWPSLAVFLIGCAGVVGFQYTVYPSESVRHCGHLFLAFVCGAWFAGRIEGVRRWALVSFFALHAAIGIGVSGLDLVRPFSPGRAAAAFLKENGLDAIPMVGQSPGVVSVISAYLDKPVFYAGTREWGSYVTQAPNRKFLVGPGTLAIAGAMVSGDPSKLETGVPPALGAGLLHDLLELDIARGHPAQVVMVFGGWATPDPVPKSFYLPLRDGGRINCEVTLLASFDKTVAPDETYHIYLVRRVLP
jgi:hypothetical protein